MSDDLASLFGKLPARGDFFHAGTRGSAELAFANWLTGAVEQSDGQAVPSPVRFFVAPSDDDTLVGTWVASRDAVHRSFPLTVSHRVSQDVEAVQWSLVFGYYGEFLLTAEHALTDAVHRDSDRLERARVELPLPHPSTLPAQLLQARTALSREHVQAFARRNFKAEPLASLAYALGTLERAVALDDGELTIDMPVSADGDVFAWLELLSAFTRDKPKPYVVLWSPGALRMLVGLRSASTQLLSFLAQPNHRSNRRWPLWTERMEAAEAVRAELDPALRSALDDDVTWSELVELVRKARP